MSIDTTNAPPAPLLPAALRDRGYRLRLETDEDVPFLTALYASTRSDELAQMTGWSAEQEAAFITHQFTAQRHHYRTQIADCAFYVIEQGGRPAGRLYLQRLQTQLHIVDIALAPEWRGAGLGTALLQALIAAASDDGNRALGIFVEKFNPALRLYRRLGFAELRDTGVYLEMERAADAPAEGPVS